MTIAHRQPVIVGVGEVADRPEDLARALDPADLMAHALWAADRDAGGGMIAALEGWTFEGPKGTTTIRAEDHAVLQPMFQARLVEQDGTWVPELIEIIEADTVAPPVVG